MVSTRRGARRVYICHTYYHAYIACNKELCLRQGTADPGRADLILSTMSNEWERFPDRIREANLFAGVYLYEETTGADDPALQALHRDRGNLFSNLLQRIRYTRALGRLQQDRIPVDLRGYEEVNVFCDSDPIGDYLNAARIPYHALEDGLNSGILDNQARLSNRGAWPLKRLMAKLGLIFIECGYSRYCIDYEVNDLSANFDPPPNTVEVRRSSLWERLTPEDHRLLADAFLPDSEGLRRLMSGFTKPCVMILTEPLCELPVRERLFGDIEEQYAGDYDVIIKPHPRDLLDYGERFKEKYPEVKVLTGRFPMEVLDDLPEFRIAKLVSVITQVDDVRFAAENVYLGLDFLDRYEDPAIHRKMETLRGETAGASGSASGDREPQDGLDLRPADPADRDRWLDVRNDEMSRRYSNNHDPIDPAAHASWFAAALANDRERLFVCEQADTFAGYLRLTLRDPGEVEISYAVAPGMRGRGIGYRLLEEAKRLSAGEFPGKVLFGEVLPENAASLRLFEKSGFTREEQDGRIRFIWQSGNTGKGL